MSEKRILMKENITVIHVTNLGHFVIFSNSYLSGDEIS
jgi:hypothetical protein